MIWNGVQLPGAGKMAIPLMVSLWLSPVGRVEAGVAELSEDRRSRDGDPLRLLSLPQRRAAVAAHPVAAHPSPAVSTPPETPHRSRRGPAARGVASGWGDRQAPITDEFASNLGQPSRRAALALPAASKRASPSPRPASPSALASGESLGHAG